MEVRRNWRFYIFLLCFALLVFCLYLPFFSFEFGIDLFAMNIKIPFYNLLFVCLLFIPTLFRYKAFRQVWAIALSLGLLFYTLVKYYVLFIELGLNNQYSGALKFQLGIGFKMTYFITFLVIILANLNAWRKSTISKVRVKDLLDDF